MIIGKQDLKKLVDDAERGITRAQLELARIYLDGERIKKDTKKGLYWLECAAASGSDEAHLELGELYWCGYGKILEDKHKAAQHLRIAASNGLAKAQYMLGSIFATDKDLKDLPQALCWYEAAAKNGDAEALYNAGIMRLCGEGAPKDIEKGASMIEEAAEKGCFLARQYLAHAYTTGNDGFQVDEDKAAKWKDLAEKDRQ